ncbi:MAG: hypothetical protein ACTS4Z_00185 [Candidatus Hodgkinia cicadicola]
MINITFTYDFKLQFRVTIPQSDMIHLLHLTFNIAKEWLNWFILITVSDVPFI